MFNTGHKIVLFFSLLLLAGISVSHASVIVNGVDTGKDSYTVTTANLTSTFTGTGTLVKADDSSDKFTGSLTGFSGTLQITGLYWTFGGANMVKGDGNDLELTVTKTTAKTSSAIFNDPVSTSPITFRYSVLNGGGDIRTSNGTQIKTCTLVVGTDTANYDGVNGHNFSGNITKWGITIGGESDFTLEKVGTNTQTLSGNNTGVKSVKISGGVLNAASAGALGTGEVTVQSGATLGITSTISVSNYLHLYGYGNNSVGALYFADSGSVSADINMQNASIGVASGKTGTISGKLYGGNTRALTKVGEGTLKLTNATNTFSILNINNGTVCFEGNATLTGQATVSSGATLELANSMTCGKYVEINGTGYNNSGALRILADTTFSDNLTLPSDATVYVAKDVTGTVSTNLYGKSNLYTLTKTGAGTLKIASSGANSLKGVVVKEGTLEAATANALGAGNVKMDGGTLKLTTNVGTIKFEAATTEWNPSGTIEVNAAENTSWALQNYQTGADISFVKTGAGTVQMTGRYNNATLKSVEIKEGTIQVVGATVDDARVFPKTATVKVSQGACVEYKTNPQSYDEIPAYTLYGGELKTNMANHLTTGALNLYGGTLTGTGGGSANYGNFLFDKNITVYPSTEYRNVSTINADYVDFAFRVAGTKAINVQENAQLDVNAVIKYTQLLAAVTYLTKEGDGVLNLTKANTYAIPTNINAGTLKLSEAGTLGATNQTVTVKSGATLEIANTQTLANPLTISGTGYSNAGAVNFTANGALGGAVTLGANSTINVAENVTGTLSGSVPATAYTLTKTGDGTLTVGQNCTVATKLVVSDGTLNLSGTVSGALEVGEDASAILNGTSSGGITLSGTWLGQIGNEQPLNLTAGNLELKGELSLPTEGLTGGTFDMLLKLENGATVNEKSNMQDVLQILTNAMTEESAKFWDLSIVGSNQIVATLDGNKIPEPATWVLLLFGALGLVVSRVKK